MIVFNQDRQIYDLILTIQKKEKIMLENKSITGRYIGLFLAGCFLFSYPVITLFNLPVSVMGIPLFFFYFFAAWAVLILLIMVCTRIPDPLQSGEGEGHQEKHKGTSIN